MHLGKLPKDVLYKCSLTFVNSRCGHCQRLEPTWEQLAEMLNEDDGNVRIAKVDCTVDSKVCSDQDVTGYPTLKFFKKGGEEPVKFRGTRDLPTLTTFINDQLGSVSEQNLISHACGIMKILFL